MSDLMKFYRKLSKQYFVGKLFLENEHTLIIKFGGLIPTFPLKYVIENCPLSCTFFVSSDFDDFSKSYFLYICIYDV